MAGMGFMIAAASRPRDDRGRYAEVDEGRRIAGEEDGLPSTYIITDQPVDYTVVPVTTPTPAPTVTP